MGQADRENGDVHLFEVLNKFQNSNLTNRPKALKELKSIFEKANLSPLNDKTYHKIYEVLFKIALEEKASLLSAKTSSTKTLNRLEACADVIRLAIKTGASTLKGKTVEAILGHIFQTLPRANGQFVEPLSQYYLKSLCAVLEHKPNVERLPPKLWHDTATFCIQNINRYLDDNDGEPSGLSHNYSGVGTSSISGSLVKSGFGNGSRTGNISKQNADDLLSTLLCLVSTPNAPLIEHSHDIATTIVRFLGSQISTVSSAHQSAFSILNTVLIVCREDRSILLQSFAQRVVPIICRFWQGRTVAKDEMLILLLTVHLHLERIVLDEESTDLSSNLSELLDVMRAEYARRSDRERLQLDDLDMADQGSISLETTPFHLHAFRLRPHNIKAERHWANLQLIGILERLVSLGDQKKKVGQDAINSEDGIHPRKRQRTSQPSDRILHPIKSEDESVRLAGLQVLPFVFQDYQLSGPDLSEILTQLSICASDKRGHIASWALLAIASCTHQKAAAKKIAIDWIQLWHIGARALTFSATCRAAAVALHAALATRLVLYRDVGEDVDAMITAADISGPVVLCDSAVFLMMHLLHARITEVPGASLMACNHVIRWLFTRWNPSDRSFAAHLTVLAQPHSLIDLLRTTLGLTRIKMPSASSLAGGPIAQAWELHLRSESVVRYLLLLEDPALVKPTSPCKSCPEYTDRNNALFILDSIHFRSARKLILELLGPKISELLQSWKSYSVERSSTLSTDTLRKAVYACTTVLLLTPHFANANSLQFSTLEADVKSLILEITTFVRESGARHPRENRALTDALLQAVQPYLPACDSFQSFKLSERMPLLLHFFTLISEASEQGCRDDLESWAQEANEDMMDIADFASRQNQSRTEEIPRQDLALDMYPGSFNIVVRERLKLITAISETSFSSGCIPSVFIDQLLHISIEDLMSCRQLLREMFNSDLRLDRGDATRLVMHVGSFLSSAEWRRCEVMHGLCLDVLIGSARLWYDTPDSEFIEVYQWFIEMAPETGFASPNTLRCIAKLLLFLIELDPTNDLLPSIRSARSSLINILQSSSASVKFSIAEQLPGVFERFLLKDHDNVFVDILQNLPADPDWTEGIAFRLYALAQLASKWSTLLRRCIYHIFETPPRIPDSAKYATRCLSDISSGLEVEGPRELFSLFAPQLLYTWLEADDIRQIPYQIFGFSSLKELVVKSQQVAAGLMVMRGQDDGIERLAELLGQSEIDVLQSCFTNIMAYSMAYSISVVPQTQKQLTGEAWLKKRLGREFFSQYTNEYFPDIIALLFNTIDNGDAEKSWMKNEATAYAGDIMKEIKSINASVVVLPPNQQPMFKARHLPHVIRHLYGRTQYEEVGLYTPALVTAIARTLLNTLHPALGSLHTCSVMRKIRVLISLSGDAVLEGYPLEMLLHSLSAFITDTECADDCFGMIQYLLNRGSEYLRQVPSFFAGTALSILGSLKILLHSSQASTTQDSQHQETMSKAERFHIWMTKYATEYESPALTGRSKTIFHMIIQSAHHSEATGNADIGTPESDLLFCLLEDEQARESLLSQPSRESVLSMLCSNFQTPTSFRTDILGNDELAIANAAVVWKSCRVNSASKKYLSWAGKALGRAFAASGHIHQELLQESSLSQIKQLSASQEGCGSTECVLSLLQLLTLSQDQRTVGLAESALRAIVTTADISLTDICEQTLSQSLAKASSWSPYQMPLSQVQIGKDGVENVRDPFTADAILRPFWLRDLAIILAQDVPLDPVLRALIPILRSVPGFAARAFPFILHLVLSTPSNAQNSAKKRASDSFVAWFKNSEAIDRNNLKMLIDSILYLRTQPMITEKSSADRSHWLDIDYIKAAVAATHCGMFKTALLFVEEHCSSSAPTKASRRSSAINHDAVELPTEVLLTIFQNIDDPDLYYGVQQNSSLSTILARLEYEKDGPKSLAFRGAQYDSHVRRKDPQSSQDVQSLVKALDVLNLSGLSHSLLQAQPAVGMSTASLESMFNTARKLEQWDIPVPGNSNNNSVTIYKAFQTVHKSPDNTTIRRAINEGFECTMTNLVREDLSANALHGSLQTLAVLVEMDEVLSARGSEQIEEVLSRFRGRSDWMKTGRFDDIGHILSCRGTILSSLSEQPRLQKVVDLVPIDAKLVEVHTMLLSSQLIRSHNALQESLSLATSLMDLVNPCYEIGLNLEAAIHMEAANALWDQGEMTSSIGVLQALDKNISFKNQTIPVGRSDLLSKIGHQVSVARLEKPEQILENYLKPALKELRGKTEGSEAGHVFHQFAVFCDQQLQDADGLEDLERLKKLSANKKNEVEELSSMYAKATSTAEKNKVRGHLSKSKTWLKLDEEELQRHMSSRDEFIRQSLENYLLALAASDHHDNNALRFSALWLEHSEKQMANEAVSKHLTKVPSRKFATLMNQLTSRLQDNGTTFQQLLYNLVLRICTDHPFHGMYQIYAGVNSHPNDKDDSAVMRQQATKKVASNFRSNHIWTSIATTNKVYCQLAAEKDDQRYKANKKVALKESVAGHRLAGMLLKFPIPSPTMQVKLAADLDYSKIPVMVKLDPMMAIASGVSAPKVITAIADNGVRYKQLVKGGNDDLRQDAIMEQVFEQVSELLKANRSTRQRNLSIRTYKVLPLTSIAGVIEFVADTIPLHEYLMPAHERYYPKDLKGNQCRKEIGDVQSQSIAERIKRFRSVADRFHPVMRYFFTEKFSDPDEWFVRRLAYTRSTAAISILGHVLGLGDRHGHNILLDAKSGEVVHIDLGVAFEMGRVLPVPELVPFRLTRDIVDGMGITKTEGVFRRCCEFTLEALRKEVENIMTILDVLRYDPLYSWSISPVRLAKLQEGQSAAQELDDKKGKQVVNEPSEADRALTVVNKKLSKTLSVTATVNDLINQASDEKNLAVLYSGWAAYA